MKRSLVLILVMLVAACSKGPQTDGTAPKNSVMKTPAAAEFDREHAMTSANRISQPEDPFEVYLVRNVLLVMKSDALSAELEPVFFVHVFPVDALRCDDALGDFTYFNRGFRFEKRQLVPPTSSQFEGAAIARQVLPDCDIESISFGQYTPEGRLWQRRVELR